MDRKNKKKYDAAMRVVRMAKKLGAKKKAIPISLVRNYCAD